MAMFPDVQKKAQAELATVVESSRLPKFTDLAGLTYLKALVMETLRWMPSAPVGLPHASIEDDVYRGYHIPKATMVIPVRNIPSSILSASDISYLLLTFHPSVEYQASIPCITRAIKMLKYHDHQSYALQPGGLS